MFRGFGSGIGMRLRTKVILWLVALAVVATLVIFSEEPSPPGPVDTCPEKGIDPSRMKEGTCFDGETKLLVVNVGDPVELRTLTARLEGTRETASLSGPAGTKRAQGKFVTFDLAITNREPHPEVLGKGQMVLVLAESHGPDLEAERRYEPHSFLAHRHPIRPGETVHGTVTFEVPPGELDEVTEHGNLDIANFGLRGDAFNPNAVLQGSEVGVMRTYGPN
jgi:hypothetical protein